MLCMQPAKQARAMPGRVGKRVGWVLPQTARRRLNPSRRTASAPGAGITLKSFKLSPLPSWVCKPLKVSVCCLVLDLGFPWCTGTTYRHTLFCRETWTDTCFPVQTTDKPSLLGVHTFYVFVQQRIRLHSREWLNYLQNFRREWV